MTSLSSLNERANNHDKRADSHSRRLDGCENRLHDHDKRLSALELLAGELRKVKHAIYLAIVLAVVAGAYNFFTYGSRLNPAPPSTQSPLP